LIEEEFFAVGGRRRRPQFEPPVGASRGKPVPCAEESPPTLRRETAGGGAEREVEDRGGRSASEVREEGEGPMAVVAREALVAAVSGQGDANIP
jgi:hypothetical protein